MGFGCFGLSGVFVLRFVVREFYFEYVSVIILCFVMVEVSVWEWSLISVDVINIFYVKVIL